MSEPEGRRNVASVKDVAVLVAKSEGTIRNWSVKGLLHYVRLNGHWLIDARPFNPRP